MSILMYTEANLLLFFGALLFEKHSLFKRVLYALVSFCATGDLGAAAGSTVGAVRRVRGPAAHQIHTGGTSGRLQPYCAGECGKMWAGGLGGGMRALRLIRFTIAGVAPHGAGEGQMGCGGARGWRLGGGG